MTDWTKCIKFFGHLCFIVNVILIMQCLESRMFKTRDFICDVLKWYRKYNNVSFIVNVSIITIWVLCGLNNVDLYIYWTLKILTRNFTYWQFNFWCENSILWLLKFFYKPIRSQWKNTDKIKEIINWIKYYEKYYIFNRNHKPAVYYLFIYI